MKTVKLDKDKLLELVKKNRAGHFTAFEKAFAGYRQECIEVLELNLRGLRENKGHIVRFMENPPEDHTSDYDRLILMLEMSVDQIVELDARTFAQYAQDDWDWKEQWGISNSKYISK
jgi:hypothetical protein